MSAGGVSLASCGRSGAVPVTASPSADIHLAVFRHMAERAIRDEWAADFRLGFFLYLRPGQTPIRRVLRVDPARDAAQQYRERHGAGRLEKIALDRRTERDLRRALAAPLAAKKARGGSGLQGDVVFTVGQIRWDGKDTAIVQAGYQYRFDDKANGDNGVGPALGWSYRLRKVGASWRVIERKQNLAAG